MPGRHFGAPPDAGVMVSKIVPGSPAESAGFELGDVVHAVDATPIGSVRKLRATVAGGGVGNDSEFAVLRGGSDLVLEVQLEAAPGK